MGNGPVTKGDRPTVDPTEEKPKPKSDAPKTEQDAPNYRERIDQGQAIAGDALSSANDE